MLAGGGGGGAEGEIRTPHQNLWQVLPFQDGTDPDLSPSQSRRKARFHPTGATGAGCQSHFKHSQTTLKAAPQLHNIVLYNCVLPNTSGRLCSSVQPWTTDGCAASLWNVALTQDEETLGPDLTCHQALQPQRLHVEA